jgi:hypothetical protein
MTRLNNDLYVDFPHLSENTSLLAFCDRHLNSGVVGQDYRVKTSFFMQQLSALIRKYSYIFLQQVRLEYVVQHKVCDLIIDDYIGK